MAQTAVKDVVIWAKHIHGADDVRERILSLKGGEALELLIDGWRGPWVRMKDGGDGRPTPGIRPIGRTREFWSELFAARRGDLVTVELAPGTARPASTPPSVISGPPSGFRRAAREALVRGLSGYRSQGPALSRDDLHDRTGDREGV